ncbi:MAG: tRNA uridine-5-carboxymethylaminomethyl(34) synthesis GTPase MnmE [Candidatus Omnitrophota bacterium]
MKIFNDDTIVAVSTPPGESGIGIVRVSGREAIAVADLVFRAKSGQKLCDCRSHSIYYGHIANDDKVVDEVLVSLMRGPKTFTREDIVEINCHGGSTVIKAILDLVVAKGARIAEQGEFTKRAFLNGRIDLVQAEAILDIITSQTEAGLRVAQRQLDGVLSKRIAEFKERLLAIVANIEAGINFPGEDISPSQLKAIENEVANLALEFKAVLKNSHQGHLLRDGMRVVICGKPNVGKSSLMNKFLKYERVIVSPHAGTTRDVVEATVNIGGVPITLIDTAGIIESEDELMNKSVDKTFHYLNIADVVLLVIDGSKDINSEDLRIIKNIEGKKVISVINKVDISEEVTSKQVNEVVSSFKVVRASASSGKGIEDIEKALLQIISDGAIRLENIFLSNSRHIESLERTFDLLEEAVKMLKQGVSEDILVVNLKDSIIQLGRITGDEYSEELLESIFSKFCIGK